MSNAFFKSGSFFKSRKFKIKLDEAKKEEEEFPSFKSKDVSPNPLFLRKKKKLIFKDSEIKKIVQEDVIEVTFKRRGWPMVNPLSYQKKNRRMLATGNWKFVQGNKIFNFKPPKGIRSRSKAYYKRHNMIIVYDLILKNWRIISLDTYNIVNVYKTKTKEEQEKFVTYYTNMVKRVGKNKLKGMFAK